MLQPLVGHRASNPNSACSRAPAAAQTALANSELLFSRLNLLLSFQAFEAASDWWRRRQVVPLGCLSALLGGCLIAPWAASGAYDPTSAAPPPSATAAVTSPASLPRDREAQTNPERLKQGVRIVRDTNAAPVTGSTTNPGPKEKSFHWKFSWQGWDGLTLETVQQTPFKNPWHTLGFLRPDTNQPAYFQVEQVKLSGSFGARMEVDAALFATTGNLTGFDDGAQVRRLRLSAGGDCILLVPVSYYLELGYGGGDFYLNQSSLAFPEIKYLGRPLIGQFQAPMGLDLITSSRDITFMEPAAPLQAIGPGIEAGLQIGQPVWHERATWTLGLFAPGAGAIEYGNASPNYGAVMGRVTWLAVDQLDLEHPSANRCLHLGLSGSGQFSFNSSVRYRSRPESYLAPHLIDTGDMAASGATTIAAEVAWVNGPFSVQGEFIQAFVQQDSGGSLHFGGGYAEVSWYLTGESRPYDRAEGRFKRLIPRRNFSFGRGGGWGALEVAARFSHTDLSDGAVQGGRLDLLMTGVNWYLHPHVRWLFNGGVGRVGGGLNNGDIFIFQTRVGVDF